MLRDDISAGLKEALKAQDKRRTATLRLILAALKDRDIEARGLGKEPLTSDEILGLLQKMIKQRQESLTIYAANGREDLATQEREEIEIISGYLPRQMSDDEQKTAIAGIVTEIGAASIKDMGKVMAVLKERYAGKMDFAKASGMVKAALAG
jgi:hypothetical protein